MAASKYIIKLPGKGWSDFKHWDYIEEHLNSFLVNHGIDWSQQLPSNVRYLNGTSAKDNTPSTPTLQSKVIASDDAIKRIKSDMPVQGSKGSFLGFEGKKDGAGGTLEHIYWCRTPHNWDSNAPSQRAGEATGSQPYFFFTRGGSYSGDGGPGGPSPYTPDNPIYKGFDGSLGGGGGGGAHQVAATDLRGGHGGDGLIIVEYPVRIPTTPASSAAATASDTTAIVTNDSVSTTATTPSETSTVVRANPSDWLYDVVKYPSHDGPVNNGYGDTGNDWTAQKVRDWITADWANRHKASGYDKCGHVAYSINGKSKGTLTRNGAIDTVLNGLQGQERKISYSYSTNCDSPPQPTRVSQAIAVTKSKKRGSVTMEEEMARAGINPRQWLYKVKTADDVWISALKDSDDVLNYINDFVDHRPNAPHSLTCGTVDYYRAKTLSPPDSNLPNVTDGKYIDFYQAYDLGTRKTLRDRLCAGKLAATQELGSYQYIKATGQAVGDCSADPNPDAQATLGIIRIKKK